MKKEPKERFIKYAGHIDRSIYKFYAEKLNELHHFGYQVMKQF